MTHRIPPPWMSPEDIKHRRPHPPLFPPPPAKPKHTSIHTEANESVDKYHRKPNSHDKPDHHVDKHHRKPDNKDQNSGDSPILQKILHLLEKLTGSQGPNDFPPPGGRPPYGPEYGQRSQGNEARLANMLNGLAESMQYDKCGACNYYS